MYAGALTDPPIPQRQNKRNLKFKPHFVLTSKPELARKRKLRDDKEAEDQAKKQRILIREEKRSSKIQEKILSVQMKAVAATAKLKDKADKIEAKQQKKALAAVVTAHLKRKTRSFTLNNKNK